MAIVASWARTFLAEIPAHTIFFAGRNTSNRRSKAVATVILLDSLAEEHYCAEACCHLLEDLPCHVDGVIARCRGIRTTLDYH
jgi:hypothetical protein